MVLRFQSDGKSAGIRSRRSKKWNEDEGECYRGLTGGLTSETHEVSRSPFAFLTPRCFRLGTPWERRTSVRQVLSFWHSSVPSVFSVRTLFSDIYKSVSRRREKKGRLRRDARVCYRGVSGFYDPAIRFLPFLCHNDYTDENSRG